MLETPGNTRGYYWACQLGTCTGTARNHARLVRHQKLNKFLEYIITGIFQLVRQKPFHGFVWEERGDGNLVRRYIHFREGEDANAAFT